MKYLHRIVFSFVIVLLLAVFFSSCLATSSDVDAARENARDMQTKQTFMTAQLNSGDLTPAEYADSMKKAIGASDTEWDGRVPEGRNWLALLLGPAAAAAVYGVREIQRRRDLKSVEETDKWVAEVERKTDAKPA